MSVPVFSRDALCVLPERSEKMKAHIVEEGVFMY